MKAKVLSVYDEGANVGTPLIGARGLAMIVDVDGERTLFDTGMRGRYLMHNLEHLEVDPDSVDRIVISHMHKDHTGGLERFLEKRSEIIDVITPPHTGAKAGLFRPADGIPKMSDEARGKMNIVTIGEWTQLSGSLFITGNVSDDDADVNENSLILMTKNATAALCGCCHHGIRSLMSYTEERTNRRLTAIVGGLHMKKMKKNDVYEIAEMLKENGDPSLYLNHCTGYNQRMYLRERLGLKGVNEFYAGTEIHF
ncbi:MAG: MBL fold metallo-hydrolase [Methanomassiliicoccaceae archaeon]|nr:MBL fold metallo-hydrolase [Methanomassiliicoccaceae archaeon]